MTFRRPPAPASQGLEQPRRRGASYNSWIATLVLYCLLARTTQAFMSPSPLATISQRPASTSALHAVKISDAVLFFEMAMKKWGIQKPMPIEEDPESDPETRRLWGGLSDPHEDLDERPDITKARQIAEEKLQDLTRNNPVSVSLYFQMKPWYLQAFREAAQDFVMEQQRKYGADKRIFWEAFQYIPIPSVGSEGQPGRYEGRLAGVVPQRCRILLMGTFADDEAEDLAKKEASAWKADILARLEALGVEPDGGVLDIPVAQSVYRRVFPPNQDPAIAMPPNGDICPPGSIFLFSLLQASWSSTKKIDLHMEECKRYVQDLLQLKTPDGQPVALRAEIFQAPDYPSVQKIWHHFTSTEALVTALNGRFTDFVRKGARYRARVNHVEQVYQPLAAGTSPWLSLTLKGTGAKLPMVGYGTGCYRGREREGTLSIFEATLLAIKAGYRLIDCGPHYGSQPEVGQAIREALDKKVVRRDRLFVTSALDDSRFTTDLDVARKEVQKSIEELGVGYLDALLLHLPSSWGSPERLTGDQLSQLRQAWAALESLVAEGLVLHLGLSNVNLPVLQALYSIASEVKPVITQVEFHPYSHDIALLEWCHEQGIQVVAHTPLGRPALSRPPGTNLLSEPLVNISANQLARTPAQIVLRWALDQGVAVIPNSLSPWHIVTNLDMTSFSLNPIRCDIISQLQYRNLRFADSSRPPYHSTAPYSRQEVEEKKIRYLDDGKEFVEGQQPRYEYEEITVEGFERLDFGDKNDIKIEVRVMEDGVFSMDIEPLEPEDEPPKSS